MDCYRIEGEWMYLDIKALPGASKNQWRGVQGGRLRVKVAAAPEDGKANGELCSFMAKALGCAKRDICLCRGERSREKTLRIPVDSVERFKVLLEENESV